MHNPKKRSSKSSQKVDWLEYMNDCLPALVIPISPRFQAVVPEWSGTSKEKYENGDNDTSRWLGTRVWPPKNAWNNVKGINGNDRNGMIENDTNDLKGRVGKGRPDSCNCTTPGSPHCVKRHVTEARMKLKSSLGPAFTSWKFEETGEEVGNQWSSKQKSKFDNLVKTNLLSQGKSFLLPAELYFRSKTQKDIVSYYLNVYVPKRISMATRSGCEVLVSDDDEIEIAPNAKNSLKRSRSNNSDITKLAKCHYLTGRR